MLQRALGIGAATAFLVAFLVVLLTSLGGGGSGSVPSAAPATTAPTARRATGPAPATTSVPKRAAPQPIRLRALGAYDPPPGDGREKDELAPLATDGDPATAWTTETYDTWGYKPGVGLVLDAGRPVRPARVLVRTDTPGFVAELRSGASAAGPFQTVSAGRTATPTTVYPLAAGAPARRYLLLWITQVGSAPGAGGAAHVSEVRAVTG